MLRRTGSSQRRLTTVMFTDIVGSTKMAAELGDRRWRQLVAKHHATVRRALKRHRGREVDTAGDGFFASFDEPGRAIQCAVDLTRTLPKLGIQIRAGINMGEVEVIGTKVGGIAVHVASRVMSLAGPGQVWVTGTVRELMAGSDVRFEDRGVQDLKGVPAQVHLYSVVAPSPDSVDKEIDAERQSDDRRSGRRRRQGIVVGGVAAVVALAILAWLLTGTGNRPPSRPTNTPSPTGLAASDRVVRVSQAKSGAALARLVSVKAGNDPSAIAVGEGSIWVANRKDGTVSRIDPVTNQSKTIPVGRAPNGIVIGEGAVWVVNRSSGSVSRIDPGTDRVVATIDLGEGGFPTAIAIGEGSVWVATTHGFDPNVTPAAVHRIDPRTNRDVASIPDRNVSGYLVIAVGEGTVWAADGAGRLMQVDPGTNRLDVVAKLGVTVGAITVADGALWIAVAKGGILKIDSLTGKVLANAPGGGTPDAFSPGFGLEELVGMTYADGILWVTGKLTGTLDRVVADGATALEPIRLGPIPNGVAVGYGSVWVSIDASG